MSNTADTRHSREIAGNFVLSIESVAATLPVYQEKTNKFKILFTPLTKKIFLRFFYKKKFVWLTKYAAKFFLFFILEKNVLTSVFCLNQNPEPKSNRFSGSCLDPTADFVWSGPGMPTLITDV